MGSPYIAEGPKDSMWSATPRPRRSENTPEWQRTRRQRPTSPHPQLAKSSSTGQRTAAKTLWLSPALIAELFQKDVRRVNEPLQHIYAESEIAHATIRKFRVVRREGGLEPSRGAGREAIGVRTHWPPSTARDDHWNRGLRHQGHLD
jgi:hypothetical protein